jgi:hypothetical protein
MQNTTTTRPQFLTALAFVLLATYSILVLSFTLEPQAYQQSDGVSWVVNGGSKVPATHQITVEAEQTLQPEVISWANNGGSKVQMMETGKSATAVHERIVGVPWAVNGSKIPAFGFVR